MNHVNESFKCSYKDHTLYFGEHAFPLPKDPYSFSVSVKEKVGEVLLTVPTQLGGCGIFHFRGESKSIVRLFEVLTRAGIPLEIPFDKIICSMENFNSKSKLHVMFMVNDRSLIGAFAKYALPLALGNRKKDYKIKSNPEEQTVTLFAVNSGDKEEQRARIIEIFNRMAKILKLTFPPFPLPSAQSLATTPYNVPCLVPVRHQPQDNLYLHHLSLGHSEKLLLHSRCWKITGRNIFSLPVKEDGTFATNGPQGTAQDIANWLKGDDEGQRRIVLKDLSDSIEEHLNKNKDKEEVKEGDDAKELPGIPSEGEEYEVFDEQQGLLGKYQEQIALLQDRIRPQPGDSLTPEVFSEIERSIQQVLSILPSPLRQLSLPQEAPYPQEKRGLKKLWSLITSFNSHSRSKSVGSF